MTAEGGTQAGLEAYVKVICSESKPSARTPAQAPPTAAHHHVLWPEMLNSALPRPSDSDYAGLHPEHADLSPRCRAWLGCARAYLQEGALELASTCLSVARQVHGVHPEIEYHQVCVVGRASGAGISGAAAEYVCGFVSACGAAAE